MNKKKGGKIAAVIDIGSNLLKMRICQLRKGEIISLTACSIPSVWAMKSLPEENQF